MPKVEWRLALSHYLQWTQYKLAKLASCNTVTLATRCVKTHALMSSLCTLGPCGPEHDLIYAVTQMCFEMKMDPNSFASFACHSGMVNNSWWSSAACTSRQILDNAAQIVLVGVDDDLLLPGSHAQ